MIQSLEKLTDLTDKLMEICQELTKENSFLTKTIIDCKMGRIVSEQRRLVEENTLLKQQLALYMSLLSQIKR